MNDGRIVRLVLIFGGLIALAVVLGGIALAYSNRTLPDAVIALGSAALGLLGGIPIQTAREVQRVVVEQPADQPVPVSTEDEA